MNWRLNECQLIQYSLIASHKWYKAKIYMLTSNIIKHFSPHMFKHSGKNMNKMP